jgi:hypothetical protein
MKYFLLQLCFLLLLTIFAKAQLWEHYYGKPGLYDFSYFAIETYDKGIITGGRTVNPDGYSYTRIIKLDMNGDSLWSELIKSSYGNQIRNIDNTIDGGIIGSGAIYIDDSEWASKPFAFRLNACGELEWCTYFETDRLLPWAQNIVSTDDGGFLMTLNSFGDYDTENTFLAKLDANGQPLWLKPVINPDIYDVRNPLSETLLKTESGHYLLSGKGYWRYNPADTIFWLRPFYALFDQNGNEQWLTPFGIADSLVGRAYACTEMGNGHLLCVARQYFSLQYIQQGFIIELDGDGNVLQYRSVGPDEIDENCYSIFFRYIEQIGDTLVLAMPYLPDQNHGYPAAISLGMDVFNDELPLVNLRIFENKMDLHHILKTSDNKIFSAKTSKEHPSYPPTDMYMLKMDAMLITDSIRPDNNTYDSLCPNPISYSEIFLDNCHIVSGLNELSKTQWLNRPAFHIQPNPGKDRIRLHFEKAARNELLDVLVYSTSGSLLIHVQYLEPNKTNIDIAMLPKGFYLVQVLKNGYALGTQKLIKY